MTTVCVPDEVLAAAVRAALPELEVLVWDGFGAEVPTGLDRVTFLVPPYSLGRWTDDQIDRFTALQVVQLMSAGGDAWLAGTPPTVTVCTGQGIHGSSTAQLAVAGLLAQWHRLRELFEQQRAHAWQPVTREAVDGKRVVIYGVGDIGRRVAGALTALGATSVLVGRTARDDVHAETELDGLCSGADALVVAVPLNDATRHRVNADLLARLADDAVVVNVARGPIVVTADLLAELESGRLRAVLDVTDPEPLPADHRLWDAPGAIVTPHVGGGAADWHARGTGVVVAQLRRYVAGAPLTHVARAGTPR